MGDTSAGKMLRLRLDDAFVRLRHQSDACDVKHSLVLCR